MKLLPIIVERAMAGPSFHVDNILSMLLDKVGSVEMRAKRGVDYSSTKFYQIRIKPLDKTDTLASILNKLFSILSSDKLKSAGFSEVQINDRSRNSSKYSSVSFKFLTFDYDIVVAAGVNKGESFEKDLLLKMDNLVAGVSSSAEASKALSALERIDSVFKVSNILSVTPRKGTTQRSAAAISPEDAGKIIADIIIKLKNGVEKYISVKNKTGNTIAQFGISKAFNDDLDVITSSNEYKTWVEPLGLDVNKIKEGLKASQTGKDVSWDDIEKVDNKIKTGSPLFKMISKMWGSGYYYLREKGDDFYALKIDSETVNNLILKNLRVTQIKYPSKNRKQITVYLDSDNTSLKLEIRNPRGKGSSRPTQVQLILLKNNLA
jgi:hypothetical protein